MNHANLDDFNTVWSIFQENKYWFPHVWNTKIKKRIIDGELIYENDVVITYSKYKRNCKIGRTTDQIAMKGDIILHQIVAKTKGNGSARKALMDFFDYVKSNVWLTVREDNVVANSLYEKVGMKQVGTITWANGTMPGIIWKRDLTNMFDV